ncbi:MAG: hypothetical protein MZV70_44385 [Desulfobacterales bacterium]|nr:hypothetical protein [Desulfobacterales bacterium]
MEKAGDAVWISCAAMAGSGACLIGRPHDDVVRPVPECLFDVDGPLLVIGRLIDDGPDARGDDKKVLAKVLPQFRRFDA